MSQHFLLSKTAKTLSLAQVFGMSEPEAEVMFKRLRWQETDGAPVCPHCGGLDAYECRRPKGGLRFRCKACGRDFSITSGTLLVPWALLAARAEWVRSFFPSMKVNTPLYHPEVLARPT